MPGVGVLHPAVLKRDNNRALKDKEFEVKNTSNSKFKKERYFACP
jgi:hypothetical protein